MVVTEKKNDVVTVTHFSFSTGRVVYLLLQMLNTSNKSGARANVLRDFVPLLDKLLALQEEYSEDGFGKQYGALPGAVKAAFSELGVTEYTVATGDVVNTDRMVVIDSQHSDDHPADTVIQPSALGLELQGNVVRMAECIASLGPEPGPDDDDGDGDEDSSGEQEEGTSE